KLVAYINPDEMIIGGVQGESWATHSKGDESRPLEPKPVSKPLPVLQPKPVESKEEATISNQPQSGDVVTKVIEVVVKHTG
ncbi:MAG: hypothetical protein QF722_06975, partial [Candidatus Thalassarchaeaceae archaeon]|nr:hypothetical protein [Candidatus Thalassarchaeaceae archaeon]